MKCIPVHIHKMNHHFARFVRSVLESDYHYQESVKGINDAFNYALSGVFLVLFCIQTFNSVNTASIYIVSTTRKVWRKTLVYTVLLYCIWEFSNDLVYVVFASSLLTLFYLDVIFHWSKASIKVLWVMCLVTIDLKLLESLLSGVKNTK